MQNGVVYHEEQRVLVEIDFGLDHSVFWDWVLLDSFFDCFVKRELLFYVTIAQHDCVTISLPQALQFECILLGLVLGSVRFEGQDALK